MNRALTLGHRMLGLRLGPLVACVWLRGFWARWGEGGPGVSLDVSRPLFSERMGLMRHVVRLGPVRARVLPRKGRC